MRGRRSTVEHLGTAPRGWLKLQRARLSRRRHPELGELNAYCFYATRLRFRDLAFDIGANQGEHTRQMLTRGARVVAVEPQSTLAASLSEEFPAATVLRVAVSDEPGEATLHVGSANEYISSLDPSWIDHLRFDASWAGSEQVKVTTLDALIREYGEPTVVKIDTEGFDHRVLRGLSRPINHVLFEINAELPDDAREAFGRLESLGRYDFYGAPLTQAGTCSWLFQKLRTPEQIIADLVPMGDVYARRVR